MELKAGDRVYLNKDSIGYLDYKIKCGTINAITSYNEVALKNLEYIAGIFIATPLTTFYVHLDDVTLNIEKTYSIWN